MLLFLEVVSARIVLGLQLARVNVDEIPLTVELFLLLLEVLDRSPLRFELRSRLRQLLLERLHFRLIHGGRRLLNLGVRLLNLDVPELPLPVLPLPVVVGVDEPDRRDEERDAAESEKDVQEIDVVRVARCYFTHDFSLSRTDRHGCRRSIKC